MNIPTLMTILGARGTGTPSAVAGAELPGAGEHGFAGLVQMLLAEQQAGTTKPAVPEAEGSPTGAGDVPVAGDGTSRSDVEAPSALAADTTSDVPAHTPVDTPADTAPADTAPADTAPAAAAPQAADVARGALAATQAGPSAGAPIQAAPNSRAGAPAADATTLSAEPVPANPAPVPAPTGVGAHQSTVSAAERPATAETGPLAPQPNSVSATNVSAGERPATAETGPLAPQPNSVSATNVSAASAPVHGPGPGTSQAAQAQAGGPVGGQVFPEIARLVTRGDGTQRLTLRLSPENLGEVRIVVTVRDGAVDISLAAGAEAQESLRHGSGDLRRLLESIGAASTQIVVRDLPATSAGQAGAQPFGSGSAATYADGGAPGREHQPGGRDRQPQAADGRRHTDAGTHPTANPAPASAAGVDLKL